MNACARDDDHVRVRMSNKFGNKVQSSLSKAVAVAQVPAFGLDI